MQKVLLFGNSFFLGVLQASLKAITDLDACCIETKPERMALVYAQGRVLPVVVIIGMCVYGPGDSSYIPGRVVSMRTYHSVILALTHDEAIGQGYLVSDGAVKTWRELPGLLADQLDLLGVKLSIQLFLPRRWS